MTLQVRPAVATDYKTALRLLGEAGLPTEDLKAGMLALAAECNGDVQGLIGVESFGEVALLRSLVIAADARGRGVGRHLVAALEGESAGKGVSEMWLLTIDADGFFKQLGYEVRDRGAAPDVIRSTAEFSGLCPDDAVLMSKNIRWQ